jgi:redox-sensitive bicupin YhaK (pirin superfamily)
MIQVIHADQRHFSDMGWLFSFSNYYDPSNGHHGALRVFNDDVVQPNTGFPTHPHEEMEIVSIVLEGELAHKDSMGNEGLIRAGEVRRMSAGIGLTHSEYNPADTPVHFYQYQMAGSLLANDKVLQVNDQARIEKESHLKLSTKRHAEFILDDACP